MLVEWDWHNNLFKSNILTSHTDSVNFDMGKGTDSTSTVVQVGGYAYEYIKTLFS